MQKVTAYIRGRAQPRATYRAAAAKGGDADADFNDDVQIIVISLKDTFYEQASGLVGVYRDQSANSSRTLTLDVDAFPE